MALKVVEALMTIGFVGLVLTHSNQFASVVRGLGSNYAELVKGLEGR